MDLLETPASNSGEPSATVTTPNPAPPAAPAERAFADHFSDEYRPVMSKFKDFDAVAKSYVEAQKFIGADKAQLIRKPNDATPEAMEEYYTALGRPAKAEEYNFALPEGAPVDAENMKEWQSHFHKAGLTNDQANAVIQPFLAEQQALAQKQELENQVKFRDNQQLVKSAWGPEFEENKNLFLNMCDKIADTKEQADHLKQVWAQDPQSLLALAKLAKQSANATDFGSGASGKMTVTGMRTRLSEIQSDPLWFDATQTDNPARKMLVDEFTRLNGLVNNGR